MAKKFTAQRSGTTAYFALQDDSTSGGGESPPPADTTPPTMVWAITISAITADSFTISWPPANDNVGIARYEYSIDDGAYVSVGLLRTVTPGGLAQSTSYQVKVRAVDTSGNVAEQPLTATATTTAKPPVQAPGADMYSIDPQIVGGAATAANPPVGSDIPATLSSVRTYKCRDPQTGDGQSLYWDMSNPARPKGPKDQSAILDYSFDWGEWLLDGGDAYAEHEFFLTGGLVLVSEGYRDGKIVAVVAGGALNQTAAITCRIITSSTPPREDERTIYLRIKDR